MTAVATGIETGNRLTRADLDAMPEGDGRRYELLDGAILVSAAPSPRHQRAVLRLSRVLDDAAPAGVEVFVAPLDVALPTGDVLEPDVLVVTPDTLTDLDVTGVPLLAVEVVLPSSGRRDRGDKLTAYRDAGVQTYWVVDPVQPRLQAWALRDGAYVETADVAGDEEWTATEPFEVTIRPVDLVG